MQYLVEFLYGQFYIHGNGQNDHGIEFMLTMVSHCMAEFTPSLLMPIPSGLMYTLSGCTTATIIEKPQL